MDRPPVYHQPVLVDEVIRWMALRDAGTYCDCTMGGAGHLMAMLRSNRRARFIGIDCDPEAVAWSRKQIQDFAGRCSVLEDNFVNLDLILDRLHVPYLDGMLFDLGVSYHQVTTPDRGFSFERDGPLLMRMSPDIRPLAQRLQRASAVEVARVLKEYGDVRNYRRLGQAIVDGRRDLRTTADLRRLVEHHVPRRFLKKNLHKVFQALRIWTNDELTNLSQGLACGFRRLGGAGRMLVIAYHSGEDRIVKHYFRDLHARGQGRLLHKKALRPGAAEVRANPSARSARLRVIEKCACS